MNAKIFGLLAENQETPGLAGGERGIRTPETLWDSMGGIGSEFGALFGLKKKHPCWREFVHQAFDSFSDLSCSLRSLAIQVCLPPFARDGVRVGLLCGEPGTFEIYQQYTNNRSNQLIVEFLNS